MTQMMRVSSRLYRFVMGLQKPRESMGAALERHLERDIKKQERETNGKNPH